MSQGDAPRRRGLRRTLAISGLLLLTALAVAVLLREPLATRAAVSYLEGQGVTVQGLRVATLTPSTLTLQDIALGDNREAAAQELAVTLSWPGLSPEVTQAEITGLRLSLDVTGESPLLGSLQPLLERFTGGDGEAAGDTGPATATPPAPRALPVVTLTDAQIDFATPSGAMTADLTGVVEPTDDGGLLASCTLNLDSPLGRFHARLEGHRDPAGILQVTAGLSEGRLNWEGLTVGGFSGRLSVEGLGGDDPHAGADLDLNGLRYLPRDGAPLELSTGQLRIVGNPLLSEVRLSLEGDGEHLELTATASAPPAGAAKRQARLTLQGEVLSAGGLARLVTLPGPQVTAGSLVLQAEGSSTLPAEATLPRTLEALLAQLSQAELSLKGDAILADVDLADGTEGISAHLPLIAESSGRTLNLTLSQDAAVRVERPALANLRRLGAPEELLPLITSGLTLTLKAGGDLPFALAASPPWPPRAVKVAVAAQGSSDQGLQIAAATQGDAILDANLQATSFTGTVETEASLGRYTRAGRVIENLSLALPLDIDYGPQGLDLNLKRKGRVAMDQLGGELPLRLGAPLALSLTDLQFHVEPKAAGYSYRFSAENAKSNGLSLLTAAEPIPLVAGPFSLQAGGRDHGGRENGGAAFEAWAKASLTSLTLPDRGVRAENLAVETSLDRGLRPVQGSFGSGSLSMAEHEALTAPLRIDGRFARKGKGYDLTAELALAEDATPLADVSGRYSDDGKARMEAASKLIVFTPEGLQPARVSPLLAALEEVDGSLSAKASLVWPRDAAAEQARITVSGLSFSGPAEVDGLDLSLTLDSLLPPTAAPGQRLTLSRLEAGVPVEAIEVTFSVESPPRLRIAEGGFDLGGARWSIAPAVLDPAAARNRIVLGTDALDLATFFRLIEVDGLSGSGTLKGSVPIVFTGEDIIVEDGRFEAQEPGRLSIRFETLRSALSGGGETVALAIQALEDFHYENLSVTLSKTAANDATVRLSTLGQNPAVLDGQPFQFNINLESNLSSVLEALQQGYSLSDDALRRAWKLRD
ncbi:YdbH domain-containing protein [Pelagibius sp. CAU 1746]|uniref:intermembrane phospholipid transport protein YdbH family protein n=1 Tax=Pelagibius sp. CAU 1746 TaxID=3140370 RepID=UPI00325C0B15